MKVTFKSVEEPQEGVAVVVIFENNTYSLEAEELDKKMGGLIQRALKATDFKGKKGQSLSLMTPAGTSFDRLVILGLGDADECSERNVTESGSALAVELLKMMLQWKHILKKLCFFRKIKKKSKMKKNNKLII